MPVTMPQEVLNPKKRRIRKPKKYAEEEDAEGVSDILGNLLSNHPSRSSALPKEQAIRQFESRNEPDNAQKKRKRHRLELEQDQEQQVRAIEFSNF